MLLDTGADPTNLIWVMPAKGNHLGCNKNTLLWQGVSLSTGGKTVSKRIVIVANGSPPTIRDVNRWWWPGDRLIAADGGAKSALSLGLVPDVVVGDMDSLDAGTRDQLVQLGCHLVLHPEEKDETDLELALLLAAKEDVSEIVILGALGGRLDQLLSNVLLLTLPELADVSIKLADGEQEAFVVRGGAERSVEGQVGDTLSLIPLIGDASGVYTQGLRWALSGDALLAGAARGVSNVIASLPVRVRLEEGVLLVVHRFGGT
jgi:thiamine pyrophosphokinase